MDDNEVLDYGEDEDFDTTLVSQDTLASNADDFNRWEDPSLLLAPAVRCRLIQISQGFQNDNQHLRTFKTWFVCKRNFCSLDVASWNEFSIEYVIEKIQRLTGSVGWAFFEQRFSTL